MKRFDGAGEGREIVLFSYSGSGICKLPNSEENLSVRGVGGGADSNTSDSTPCYPGFIMMCHSCPEGRGAESETETHLKEHLSEQRRS
jgi:hypothetical protein